MASTSASDLSLRKRDCSTLAEARRYIARTYFISCPNTCGANDTPVLSRVEPTATGMQTTALVDGIESIHFEYGFDTNSDGAPDVFLRKPSGTAGAADNDWSNVVAVRLFVIARTTNAKSGYRDEKVFDLGLDSKQAAAGDAFKRHMQTALVRVVNPSGAREISP